MQECGKHGSNRLLVISSIGAAQGIKRKGLRRNIYLWLRRKYYRDMFEMEREVATSGLTSTIVRAPMLYNGPAKNDYRVFEEEDYFDVLKISRADIAHFLLEDMENGIWSNRVVTVADNS